ncbi:MAG: hypothetical protein PWQ17_832 [Anaerophaga sp.]|uniref:DUF1573 domain-containing protein n=1 Tax=Anaerophaga thermohalophila TaxID=177400 RepID=UPI000237CA39|nr:DUF1573 domain-containing protein [Anaerophaga thermohalophila]MDI3520523.1 hypothetical protein [Anaerophaga sp.]MDK2841327.1 hypothetical protein [Anaerophaga sp.]MDN5290984.1 hypothetical protein [Anaerophaga sp.]
MITRFSLVNKVTVLLIVGTFSFTMSCCTTHQKNRNDKKVVDQGIAGNDSIVGEPVFSVTEHDFGTIQPGQEVGARFGFENKGASSLIIERVVTGCGCTVAKYTEKPVKPGESGFVEVIFDTRGKRGAQFQQVSVYFQGTKKPVRLSLVAQVTKK